VNLEGPQVWQDADKSVLVKTNEKRKSDQTLKDEMVVDELVSSILINSGLDAFIMKMAKTPESFFEGVNADDEDVNGDDEDKNKKEFVDRYIEIIKKDWRQDEIDDHYVTSLKDKLSITDLRKIESLFNTPDFCEIHTSLNEIVSIDFKKLEKFTKQQKRKSDIPEEKIKMVREIEQFRKLPNVILTSFEVSNRSILTAMNEIAPKNRRKTQEFIEQDVKDLLGPYQRYWIETTYNYMLQKYQDVALKDLHDYLKLIKTESLQAFIDQEKEIFSTFLTKHMISVEGDVKNLMSEMQKDRLGIEVLPSLSGLKEEEIIQLLFDTYGKEKVIESLLSKVSGTVQFLCLQ